MANNSIWHFINAVRLHWILFSSAAFEIHLSAAHFTFSVRLKGYRYTAVEKINSVNFVSFFRTIAPYRKGVYFQRK